MALPPETNEERADRTAAWEELLDELGASGPGEVDLERYRAAGMSDAQVGENVATLLAAEDPAVALGPRERLADEAAAWRTIAEELEAAGLTLAGTADPKLRPRAAMVSTFLVENPREAPETIALTIRPASLSPDWELAIVPVGRLPDGTFPEVYEDEVGRAYRVDLPARTRVPMTTIVVPFGEVAEESTARWAVEGRIRGELLGGSSRRRGWPRRWWRPRRPCRFRTPSIRGGLPWRRRWQPYSPRERCSTSAADAQADEPPRAEHVVDRAGLPHRRLHGIRDDGVHAPPDERARAPSSLGGGRG